jgi:hypothetical protein
MKKVLLAFDGHNFSKGACEFARMLNENEPILLIGSFLPQIDFANLWSYSGGGLAGPMYVPLLEGDDSEAVQKNIKRFESYCQKNGIEYRVHKDFFDFALPELKKESRFADLILLGGETFYENLGANEPNDYLKEALHGIECPAMVIPEEFEFPVCNVLTYDGSESSVYAIKQFAYLFPEFVDNKTILIYIKEKGEKELPEQVSIEELAARHFKDLTLLRLQADPKKYFSSFLLENKGAILVSGAFGRSAFSRSFKKSFVTETIQEHKIPVFIAHP